MRSSKRLSALAVIVAAAGLSLTACGPDSSSASGASTASGASGTPLSGGSGATPSSSPSSSSPNSSSGASGSSSGAGAAPGAASGQGSGSSGSGGGSGSSGSGGGAASGSMCRTSNLTITAQHGISGEGMEIVNLKNSGSSSCTMRGYPGVDLRGKGDTTGISATRYGKGELPTVKLAPGQSTQFVLYYPYNNSGGTGYTFTTLVITPPNETYSKTVSASINVPVDNPDQDTKGPGIVVHAVGTGK
ncbi:DUF4232 domain-containing protein [Streptomyces sp. NRRL F-5126]|uniref:DUF4232 domain-containing protein n=1 Tax=Streptomyces sp. NRRL F-5126 TaxID=1463857 RepID=UPI0004C6F61D|nr:DUF4232 domain-containing protein [Streptomyces sp. NRRL F-5126]